MILRIIIEKRIRKDKLSFITFVDIEKAFNEINCVITFKILKKNSNRNNKKKTALLIVLKRSSDHKNWRYSKRIKNKKKY